jgi:hypothetical protein
MGARPDQYQTYQQLLEGLPSGRVHLLLGNGFSIACDPIFRYASLYDAAVQAGLSLRAQQVFARLGTNNFEGVLRLLEDAEWVALQYGITPAQLTEVRVDVDVVRNTLVQALTSAHLDHPGLIADERKGAARRFIDRYHNVFTTNYDLLLYWVVLHGEHASHQDGFRPDEEAPDAQYLVFTERLGDRKAIFYVHGAIHLYLQGGDLRKHSWIRSDRRLTDLIREGLQQGRYPLFVAEGTPDKKLEQIQRVGYLWYALEKLSRIRGPLVVFGHSLGESDRHISAALARNTDLRELFVGLHGDPERTENQLIRAAAQGLVEERRRITGNRRGQQLAVHFFDSSTTAPWG